MRLWDACLAILLWAASVQAQATGVIVVTVVDDDSGDALEAALGGQTAESMSSQIQPPPRECAWVPSTAKYPGRGTAPTTIRSAMRFSFPHNRPTDWTLLRLRSRASKTPDYVPVFAFSLENPPDELTRFTIRF